MLETIKGRHNKDFKETKSNIWTKENFYDYAIYSIIFLVCIFIITYIGEYIFRGSFVSTSAWIRSEVEMFIQNYVLVGLLLIVLLCIFNSIAVAFCVEAIGITIISSINYYKYMFKGEVLTFSDFKLFGEAANIISNYEIKIPACIIISLIIIILCTGFLCWVKVEKIKLGMKVSACMIAIVSIYLFCAYLRPYSGFINDNDVTFVAEQTYQEKGLIVGMVKQIRRRINKPTSYSKEMIQQILAENTEVGIEKTDNSKRPNVIMIMNESFYDIELLEGVQLSEDCMPNLRRYQDEFGRINLLVPTYGGGTCQSEYEVLTGYPTNNTSGYLNYTELVGEQIDSIVNIFNNKGYYTMAMHPNIKTFFNRTNVYDAMGFDKTIFIDDMENPEYEGINISDKYVYNQIINQYENRDTDEPIFTFLVTIQNHSGYGYEYDKHGIKVLNEDLGDEANRQLQTFANLVRESDESLQHLIEYFEKVDEPTIIVFFGDHSPAAGFFNMDTKGEKNGNTIEEVINQYMTPALIWSNEGKCYEGETDISAYKLGASLLDILGFEEDTYFNFVASDKIVSAILDKYIQDDTILQKDELSEEHLDNLDKLWLLQYDRMFGERFSFEGDSK